MKIQDGIDHEKFEREIGAIVKFSEFGKSTRE